MGGRPGRKPSSWRCRVRGGSSWPTAARPCAWPTPTRMATRTRRSGRWLIEQGELTSAEASAQGIKAWIAAHPERRQDLFNANPSFIFFREERLPDPSVGPRGALGVALTPARSVAIDPTYLPLGGADLPGHHRSGQRGADAAPGDGAGIAAAPFAARCGRTSSSASATRAMENAGPHEAARPALGAAAQTLMRPRIRYNRTLLHAL